MYLSTEAFIRNFSSPHSHLQRYLVGDVDRKKGGDHAGHLEKEKKSKNLLITELTTSSFVSSVMDQEKVNKIPLFTSTPRISDE